MPAALPPLELSVEQQSELLAITRRRTEPSALVQRARVILHASEGLSNRRIGELVAMAPAHVGTWRRRFAEEGVAGLRDKARSGRPARMDDRQRLRICQAACRKPPAHLSRWSISTLAKSLRLPRNRVERALADADLHPHRIRTFNFSPDPQFGEKLLDVVGLYMAPSENAVVLCVDEKTGIQALDRTQPMLPMSAGKPRCWSNEYVRHGTRTLLASLDIATGKVLAHVRKDRTSKTFLKFMDAVVAENRGKPIHVVLDNLNTHTNKAAQEWLAANRDVEWTTLLGRIYQTRAWDYRRYVTLVVDAIDAVRCAPVEEQALELDRQVYLALTHRDLGEQLNVGDDDPYPDVTRFEGWPYIGMSHRDPHTGNRVPGPSADAVADAHAARATSAPPTAPGSETSRSDSCRPDARGQDGRGQAGQVSPGPGRPSRQSPPSGRRGADVATPTCPEPCCSALRRAAGRGVGNTGSITRIDGRTGKPVTDQEYRELRKAWTLANHEGILPF